MYQLHTTFYLAVLIGIAALLIYLPSLFNGFVSWDDDFYVYENANLRLQGLAFLKWALTDLSTAGLWQPLVWISYGIDHSIWQMNPVGYHLTAILLHSVNTFIVVFLVAKILLSGESRRDGNASWTAAERNFVLITSGVTGILFGLHPLHVESVAWITERKDLLYALFYFLSINWYLNFAADIKGKPVGYSLWLRNRNYLFMFVFFVLALSSKSMAVTLPIVLLILDWCPLRRIFSLKSFLAVAVEKIPLILCSFPVSLITVSGQKLMGGMKLYENIPWYERLLVGIKSLTLYVWKTVAPHDLSPFYPYPKPISLLMPEFFLPVLLTAGISVLCILAHKQRIWLSIWGFYVITLLPVLGIFQAGLQAMADRFIYVASIGPFILAGMGIALAWNRAGAIPDFGIIIKRAIIFIVVIMSAAMGYKTVKQISIWKDSLTFWTYILEREPVRFVDAYLNRGMAHWEKNRLDLAIEDFSTAIKVNPQFGAAYLNRGMAFMQKGEPDLAERDYSSAIIHKADDIDAYNNRGSLYNRRGKYDLAIEDLNKAISLNPSYFPAYVNRGIAYSGKGDLKQAISDYSRALSLKPDAANVYLGRGDLHLRGADTASAMNDYQQACKLGSDAACLKLKTPTSPLPAPPKATSQKAVPGNPAPSIPVINFKGIDEMINKMKINPEDSGKQ